MSSIFQFDRQFSYRKVKDFYHPVGMFQLLGHFDGEVLTAFLFLVFPIILNSDYYQNNKRIIPEN